MDPVITAALITGGSQLAGGLASGIGSGISKAKEAEKERLRLQQEQENFDKTFGLQKQQTGMQGIGLLASLRDQAKNNFKNAKFKDAVYNTLRG